VELDGLRRHLGRRRDQLKVLLTGSPRAYRGAQRAYALGRFALRQPHDPDYAVFAEFPERRGGIFLDVGANSGMSAFSFRIYAPNPILSIEPNPYHDRDLKFVKRILRRHDYLICAAGAQPAMLTLHVPVYRGTPLTTEASLMREEVAGSVSLRQRLGDRMDDGHFEIRAVRVPVRRLDDLQLEPDFVKLDVQGAELDVLRGLTETLERHRPVLLIETPSRDVRNLLAERRYEAFRFDPHARTLVPETAGAINVVFVPRG
jgi:FkbM family methyltransferase